MNVVRFSAEEIAENRIQQQEYNRRQDLAEERDFWKSVFFRYLGELENLNETTKARAIAFADSALDEYRSRFS